MKKTVIDTNQIYDSYKKGQISEQKTIQLICKTIYLVPEYYGLKHINNSNIGEFIIFLYPCLTKTLVLFSEEKSSFSTYLQTIVRLQYKSFLRKKIKENAKFNSLKTIYHEIDSENSYYCFNEPCTNYLDSNSLCNIKFSDNKIINNECYLVFALKLSHYLTQRDIEILSKISGIDENTLWSYKDKADEYLKRKKSNLEKKENSLTSVFLSRNIRKTELDSLRDINYYYFKVKNTYSNLDNKWKNMIKNKKINNLLIVPNCRIAKILNTSVSKIRTIITYIKKYDENLFS